MISPSQRVNWLNKSELAQQMYDFIKPIPSSMELDGYKDLEFLFYYEAERFSNIRDLVFANGFRSEEEFQILDVGYLHGLIPEFLQRSFPKANITVIDHPDSPVFKNAEYKKLIQTRNGVEVLPCNLEDVDRLKKKFHLVILGEVIEHLDPTFTVNAIAKIRAMMHDKGCLIITTPNLTSLRNSVANIIGNNLHAAVVPDELMMWPHIHEWPPKQLKSTLEHYGWQMSQIRFYSAFERHQLAHPKKHGIPFGRLIYRWACYLVTQRVPRLRDMFLASFVPVKKEG
jgi:2-polyprenyl-3-methyl-5-hydroxy-6-metoxy-1,4-benzoquinol methylase